MSSSPLPASATGASPAVASAPPRGRDAARLIAEGALHEGSTFWQDALAWQATVAPLIVWRVVIAGLYAALVTIGYRYFPWESSPIHLIELSGAVLALMLVLRTNAGYDRWWEARKLWGGIINQSRNLVLNVLTYGPTERAWRERLVRWVAAFGHVARRSLRGERGLPELHDLLPPIDVARIEGSSHMPSFVLAQVADLLRDASDRGQLPAHAFTRAEEWRAQLLDHVGGCERILRTRFPLVHRSVLGQLTLAYLGTLPFMIVGKGMFATGRATLLTMLVAYLLFALDQIARELGNPFSLRNRSHLPLDDVSRGLQQGLLDLLEDLEPRR